MSSAKRDGSTLGRLGWAASMRRRPRTPTGWLRLAWHDFVVHGLLNRGGERCQDCGRDYVLWRASDDLYELVHGSPAGLLCPWCFDRQAAEKGVSVEFQAVQKPSVPEMVPYPCPEFGEV